MNKSKHPNRLAWRRQIMAALLAGVVWIPAAQSQIPAHTVENRYLLIFDTSSAMKKHLLATQKAVNQLFLSMMNGQLQPNDSIGVWAFDSKLRTGQFPLQRWLPENAANIASNITTFIQGEHYSRSTHFDAIMPSLNGLVQESDRLTVLIFCDGNEKIQGTPFDNAINSIFKEDQRAVEKAKQVFIVVLRTQFGQYVGDTVNFSAIGVNFPEFPPLPQSSQPAEPVKTRQPLPTPPPAIVTAPPLVIVGTNVSTNLLPPSAVFKSPPVNPAPTNPPPTAIISNPPPPPLETSNPTNIVLTNATPSKTPEIQTNTPATPKENSGLSGKEALAIAIGFLAAAGVSAFFVLHRSRRTRRGSFITRSMKKD
jgi:hypothetical protein